MAFTYPPTGGGASAFADLTDVNLAGVIANDRMIYNGTEWIVDHSRAGTLLTPQTIAVDGGANVYTPLVTVGGNNSYNLDGGSALPFVFDKGTSVNAISLRYFQNLAKAGTTNWGEKRANPGWDYRLAVYGSDPVTGLPTTLLLDHPTVETIPALDELGGQESGVLSFTSLGLYVPANTPVWVTIIAVPVIWPGWEDGFTQNDTYLYNPGTETFDISSDPEAGYIRPAFGYAFQNNLAPLSTVPVPPRFVYEFGNAPARNCLLYQGFNPFDYSGEGGPVATNAATYDFQVSWPSWNSEWPPSSGINHTYEHVAAESGFLPLVVGQLD